MKLARYAMCAAALAPVMLLAACGDDTADVETSGEGGQATGEVFAPTVSDAMIATDQLRSSPPLLGMQPAPTVVEDEPEADAMEQALDEGEAEPEPSAAPAPAPVAAEPEREAADPAPAR